jgi:hypothetical protein
LEIADVLYSSGSDIKIVAPLHFGKAPLSGRLIGRSIILGRERLPRL